MPDRQLTFESRHHQLTNAQIWTPDSQWLVFDVRPPDATFNSQTVERVNITTGVREVIYRASQGACVGVVSCSPQLPERYVCIHGPENPDQSWYYDFHHRRGVIISDGQAVTLDGCDITPPYTAGALRGGSHVHMFDADGEFLSFTYNDHVMHQRSTAEDLRNVGVAVPLHPVIVSRQHPRGHDGSHFCVIVSQTTPFPDPGSDQINRAYEEGWVGHKGYRKASGEWQRRALVFIGDTLSTEGKKVPEIFIVDLPDDPADFAVAGEYPLQGTGSRLPAPPAGVTQRRLTYSRGIALQPRHWLRTSPDGSMVTFLMADTRGIIQLWGVSPAGGSPQQITDLPHSISSVVNWHPQVRRVAFICDNSVMICDPDSGDCRRVTQRTTTAPCGDAVVWSPDGEKIAFMRDINGWRQLFIVDGFVL
ncbi:MULTISPECIES: DUF3748 domain-containing protein [Tatumella]|uniref:DUF3748 domain-containing protein n=1 Tax=Tatumella punctata TaxID=399969 RepID=A0ABW1VLY4_9GAMM|nr:MULTISPECIES: DUF3748 domain-containing protein [unclassified Tatumella]MBS0876609.1 DUF3748 domain-containing protein [Tatumella sp. JGM82]MBS0890004.1 DUF3748 domain-containing protein [Tatumella sp. JGM94]MBS0893133.1 DUF3748 domain-containing protein [Tatumella sp. JGM130]MBS0901248.1 DUF3748 domain-containing protein [Tatumella sp. JGM100]